MSKPGWHDVTATLRACAQGMPCGKMLHTQAFTLHQGMTALEVMDRKMDPWFDLIHHLVRTTSPPPPTPP